MQKTTNYNLNQWEPHDEIRVEDFNADNAAIDAALGELSAERIYIGSYVGDGKASRTIELPWEPTIAIVMGHVFNDNALIFLLSEINYYSTTGGWGSSTTYNILLKGSTFVIQSSNWSNIDGKTVRYILLR